MMTPSSLFSSIRSGWQPALKKLLHYLRLIRVFILASLQQAVAYRADFYISLLHSLLNFGAGVLGVLVVFGQVETIRGWDFPSTLALLGVYLAVGALRGLFIGPSLESMAGMEGEVWTGRFDFTLLRPVSTQFLASIRHWRPFALFDLLLGLLVVAAALAQPGAGPSPAQLLAFFLALSAGVAILYAILLASTALVFISPGFLFTWVFDGLFQMARYPLGLYPGWARLLLTWVIPVGLITTVPAQALTGRLAWPALLGVMLLAAVLVAGASFLFRWGLIRYHSASS
jgi:ABC-2 type transport system permease protein